MLRTFAIISILLLVVLGCGGGGNADSGRVQIHQQDPEGVLKFAAQVRITMLDSQRRPVTPGVIHEVAPEYVFEGVPLEADFLTIDYLSASAIVSTVEVDIDLSDGAEEVRLTGNSVGYAHFIENDSTTQLIVGGFPIFIKGVGFDYTQLDQSSPGTWFSYVDPAIANIGANCVRMYGIPWTDGGVTTPGSPAYQAQAVSDMLAYCASNSMYLLVPVFVDGTATDARVTAYITLVQNDPNFSRVIGYCVGNEVGNGFFTTVNSLASTIKSMATSPAQSRPIMTALPAVSAGFVSTIQSTMPNLDWLGINTFYGNFDATHAGGGYLNTQAASLKSGGWKKPWAITEYYSYDIQASDMPNQVMNGASPGYMLECNSTLNAQNYANSYSQYISSGTAKKAGCVGGFMLNFGPPHNSKLVASWLEPFTYTGSFTPFVNPPWNNGANSFIRLGATDAVAALYGGSFGSTCPSIVLGADNDPQGITCSFKATLTSAGTPMASGQSGVTASVLATGTQPLTFSWYLIGGSSSGFSGDITAPGLNPQAYEQSTTIYLGAGVSTPQTGGVTNNTLTFTLPVTQQAGMNNYQLRVIVSDPNGGGATAAIGFPMQ